MSRIFRALGHSPLAWILLVALVTMGAFVEPRVEVITKDSGLYYAILSTPRTFTLASLVQAITDLGSAKRKLVLSVGGTWAITDNLTVPANFLLTIPQGAAVSISANKTLTLAGCPQIDAPGWLTLGSGATVKITAPACLIEVHKYATGGDGATVDTAWTGWEHVACQNTWSKHIHYAQGYYGTSQSCVLNDANPNNAGLGGNVTVTGDGMGLSVIVFDPNDDTPDTTAPIVGLTNYKTWLTIGGIGRIAVNVHVKGLTVASHDVTTYRKRAFHFIDLPGGEVRDLSVAVPGVLGWWHDATARSVAVHIEGRGTSTFDHFILTGTDYPLWLDGTPNEGGPCYPTEPGWTGSPGACEFDTMTVSNMNLEVVRGYYDTGDGVGTGKHWVNNPNILIGGPTELNRCVFSRIACNGGSYCLKYSATNSGSAAAGHNTFIDISQEDPAPLNPSDIAASRIAAGVPPKTMVEGDPYGDDAALSLYTAWGFMMIFDMNDANSQAQVALTLKNVSNQDGGNGLSFHRINQVTIENYHFWGNGLSTHTYPGQMVWSSGKGSDPADNCAPFPAASGTPYSDTKKAVALDLTGNLFDGPSYTSFPVTCTGCSSGYETQIAGSSDLSQVITNSYGLLSYYGVNTCNLAEGNVFKSATVVSWDAVNVVNPSGSLGTFAWTPVLHCDGSEPTIGSPVQAGLISIQQVGDKKQVFITFTVGGDISGGSGNVYVSPLAAPFLTPTSTANIDHALAVGRYVGLTLPSGQTQLAAYLPHADARIVLIGDGSGIGPAFLQCSNLTSGFRMAVSGSYLAD